jgi:hypothetical protein
MPADVHGQLLHVMSCAPKQTGGLVGRPSGQLKSDYFLLTAKATLSISSSANIQSSSAVAKLQRFSEM